MSEEESFFMKLKKLAGSVDRRVSHLESVSEGKASDYCEAQAIKTLSDLKTELKKLHENAESEDSKIKKHTCAVVDIVSLSDKLLDKLRPMVDEREEYLRKYGYISKGEGSKAKEEDKQANGNETEESKPQSTPPKQESRRKQDSRQIPRLEDTGISQATLTYMNNLQQATKVTSSTNSGSSTNTVKQVPDYEKRRSGPETPAVFQHNGILVTPSLMGFGKSMADRHEELASPVPPIQKTPAELPINKSEPLSSSQLQTRLTFEDMTEDGSADRTLTSGNTESSENTRQLFSSPVSPVLKAYGKGKLTYLKQEATFTNSKDANSEPMAPTITSQVTLDLTNRYTYTKDMPKPPEALSGQYRSNTPPVPELQSQRFDKQAMGDPLEITAPKKHTISGGMPVMPKLHGKYTFLSKENEPPTTSN